jgi:hypothetical protein
MKKLILVIKIDIHIFSKRKFPTVVTFSVNRTKS